VNRGWVPRSRLPPDTRAAGQTSGTTDIVGIIRQDYTAHPSVFYLFSCETVFLEESLFENVWSRATLAFVITHSVASASVVDTDPYRSAGSGKETFLGGTDPDTNNVENLVFKINFL
jgi:hypothetical protein